MRQRNPRPIVPRRSRRGQTIVSSQTLAQEAKGEYRHLHAENHDESPMKAPAIKFYERRT